MSYNPPIGATTSWERCIVSAEIAKYLRGTHLLYNRLFDGEPIYLVVSIGHEPTTDGGYRSIDTALRVKGMRS
jgi:hypothetical protein